MHTTPAGRASIQLTVVAILWLTVAATLASCSSSQVRSVSGNPTSAGTASSAMATNLVRAASGVPRRVTVRRVAVRTVAVRAGAKPR